MNYFNKNPQTTIALTFLTHIIYAIGGVYTTYFIVQYLVVYLLDIVGQDIDIPANILNIYYVFSFIDPKMCRLFWLSKKHGLNPETETYRSPVEYN